MSYSLEEMSAWTPEEIVLRIREELPKGWTTDYGYNKEDRLFFFTFLDGEGEERWSELGLTAQILFLDAYGWLTLRGKKPQHPVWQRRGEIDPRTIGVPVPAVAREPVTDPEDVDPAEVAAVYTNVKD